jgi:tRNA A-37 threonylcarbamoyl transferase component Bud32
VAPTKRQGVIKMTKQCPNCATPNRDDARFCSNCATPLVSEIPCPSCGTANRPEARFCYYCAMPLKGLVQQTGMLQPNAVLAERYTIVRKVGGGGMGAVYQATDQRIQGKLWAIKEMSDTAITNPLDKQRAVDSFRREAQLLATLDHGNLPKVSDYFTEEGKHYLVMDFVQGRTLEQVLHGAAGFLGEDEVVDWAIQLCDVLAYLHSRQPPVIFRDLKPANVMLDAERRMKLIDFGIARLFQPGKGKDTQTMGTPGYAAPEQYGTGQTDARSDIYALGVTLHQLLTGYDPSLSPFNLPPARNINSGLSPTVEAIIARASQPEVTARFQTAEEMKEALAGRVPVSPLLRQAVSPPVTTVTPYTLAPGLVAHSVGELVQICEQGWERAVSQFCNGYFETWLRETHQYGLADEALRIVNRVKDGDQFERGLGLAEWLAATGHSKDQGILRSPELLDCGVVPSGPTVEVSLDITNTGTGYLFGRVSSLVPWLSVPQAHFGCSPGNVTQIKIQMHTRASPVGVISEKVLLIESRSGRQIVRLQARITKPVLTISPDVLILDKHGRGTLTIQNANVGGRTLGGTIEAKGWIVAEPTGSFRSDHLTITVKDKPAGPARGNIGQVIIHSNGGDKTIPVQK